jgi:hypothetical protein
MPANDFSMTPDLDATINLCRELARTVLILVRMYDPEQPAVRARVSAIVMLLASARLICKAEPPLEEMPSEVLKLYESTLQKLSEQLVRNLVPELAAQIDAEMARAGSSSRESTIASLRALTAQPPVELRKTPPFLAVDFDPEDAQDQQTEREEEDPEE